MKRTCDFCGSKTRLRICDNLFARSSKSFCICDTCLHKVQAIKIDTSEIPKFQRQHKEYIQRWYKNFNWLTKFFPEDDVTQAIFNAHFSVQNGRLTDTLTQLISVDETKCLYQDQNSEIFEYVDTVWDYIPEYDRSGREYADYKHAKCRRYRTYARHQGLKDGNIVLQLLYGMRPKLKQFDFAAYTINDYTTDKDRYEIYPKNQIYTPFIALMNRDIDAICTRNMAYAKSYNFGAFTVEEVTKRLKSDEAQHYFNIIREA